MQQPLHCPFCKAEIPLDDVNVATDIALCRACGRTAAFSMLQGVEALAHTALEAPPKGVRIERDVSGGARIIYRRLSPVLFFLIPFTALWSGGSMWGIYIQPLIKGTLKPGMALFGLPFLLGTLVLLGVITFLAAGRWVVTLHRGTGSVFVGMGTLGWTRTFTYDRQTLVSLRMTDVEVNHHHQTGIWIKTGETELTFGALLKEDAKQFIASAIMRAAAAC
jgi:hypothetical protein